MQRAIDFIDAHLGEPITIEAIASAACLSPYHFARVFRSTTGRSVMEYTRARRLCSAVLRLRSEPEVALLDIALDAGFDSQQGFTNAFKRAFGATPGAYRSRWFPVPLQEKYDMAEANSRIPRGPEFRSREAFLVAGLSMRCDQENKVQIPQLWQRFAPRIGSIPNQVGSLSYGVCIDAAETPEEFTYVAAVEVSSAEGLDEDLEHYEIPAADYAVFTHEGSLDFLQQTMTYIFGPWLTESGYELAGTPDFELYDERFKPETVSGEMEIWVPVKPKA